MALDKVFTTILTRNYERKPTKNKNNTISISIFLVTHIHVRVIHAKAHSCLVTIDFVPYEFCLGSSRKFGRLNVRKIKVGYAVMDSYATPYSV